MGMLFMALQAHPMGAASELLVFAVRAHRQIAVHGVQLIINLRVHRLLHGFVEHHYESPQKGKSRVSRVKSRAPERMHFWASTIDLRHSTELGPTGVEPARP